MKEQKVYYYSDELNDDFAGTNIERKPLPDDYEFLNKGFWAGLRRFIFYYCLVRPLVFVYNGLIKRVKYVGKKKLKGYKKSGAFMYGNHTSMIIDAFNPSRIAFPRPADVIVNADAVSIKGIGWFQRRFKRSRKQKTLDSYLSRSAYLALLYGDTPVYAGIIFLPREIRYACIFIHYGV